MEQIAEQARPLADSIWLSESGVIIALLEAALLVRQDAGSSELVDRSALVDVRSHYSDDLGQLSVFASLDFEAHGHLRLGGVDEDHALVRVELRDPDAAPLFVWEVPVEFFLDEGLRRTSSEHRVEMLLRAVRNVLERDSRRRTAIQPAEQPKVRRLFNPRKGVTL